MGIAASAIKPPCCSSAQIRLTTASGRLVYTGDFKPRPGLSCETPATRSAEVLIMETTCGLPRYRFKCDALFPLSDHADYEDLLRYVEQVSPRIVYTLHGYAEEFARDLRARGMEAWSLISNNQLELPLLL